MDFDFKHLPQIHTWESVSATPGFLCPLKGLWSYASGHYIVERPSSGLKEDFSFNYSSRCQHLAFFFNSVSTAPKWSHMMLPPPCLTAATLFLVLKASPFNLLLQTKAMSLFSKTSNEIPSDLRTEFRNTPLCFKCSLANFSWPLMQSCSSNSFFLGWWVWGPPQWRALTSVFLKVCKFLP